MKKFLKKIGVLALTLCVGVLPACRPNDNSPDESDTTSIKDTSIVLAGDGTTSYSVIIPNSATEAESYAAELLQEQFEKATGASLAIVKDGGQSLDENKKV